MILKVLILINHFFFFLKKKKNEMTLHHIHEKKNREAHKRSNCIIKESGFEVELKCILTVDCQ
jgi:hypothetical protein